MSIPNMSMYVDSSLASLLAFETRPLGSSGSIITSQIWNDKSVVIATETLGTGTGSLLVFTVAHGNIVAGSYIVKVAGVAQSEGTAYSINRITGVVTFASGSAPASGAAVTISYAYGTGAGNAATVWLIVKRIYRTVTANSSTTAFTLPTTPEYIFEVLVSGSVVTDWSVTGSVVTLGTAPASGVEVEISYQDEGGTKQVVQARSSGIVDPYSTGIVNDAQASYTALGGSTIISGESVGTGNGSTTVFELDHAPIVSRSVAVTVAGVSTEVTVHSLLGQIEFTAAPADGSAILVSYRYYNSLKLGAIPANAGRYVYLRGRAPTVAGLAGEEGTLSIEAI